MKLSVVIPCYNAANTIADQLYAVQRQNWDGPWEVIVADNGSSDGSSEIVRSMASSFPKLCLVDASRRKGAAHARNQGVAASSGDIIVFCDADDVVGEDWLPAMARALQRVDFAASRFDFRRLNGARGEEQGAQSDGIQKLWYPPYLPHSGSGGLGVKRWVHEKVSGFDETLPRLMDTDYCLRIQLAGVSLNFVPDAVVHVRLRTSAGRSFTQARLWAKYNALIYKKYRPDSEPIPRAWRHYFVEWKRLLRQLPAMRHSERRRQLIWKLGWQVGALQGAISYRVSPV